MSEFKISDECYAKVEGAYKKFQFRRIEASDYKSVCDFVADNFLRDEPTSKLLGWSEDYVYDFNRVVERFLPQGLSFIAEHAASGKIAAVLINQHQYANADITNGAKPKSRQSQILRRLVGGLFVEADLVGKHGIDNWVEFFVASTSPEFRRQGLEGELFDRSMEFFKCAGFKDVLVVITSPYTKRASMKRGFVEVSMTTYDKVTDEDGNLVFDKSLLTPDHACSIVIKKL